MKYFTIYETTNIMTGKKYIGKHVTDNLNDDYLGSGLVLKHAINKYGKENFVKKVLYILDNEDEMNSKEKALIDNEIVNSEEYYNIALGGKGGCIVLKEDHPLYDDTRKKISKSAKTSSKIRSDVAKEMHKEKRIGMYGRSHSDKTKQKISEKNKGRIHSAESIEMANISRRKTYDDPNYTHPNKGKKFSKERMKTHVLPDTKGEKNGMYGKTHSVESRERMRKSAAKIKKTECPHCNGMFSPGTYSRWHGENCRRKDE